jgi:hypothetical protein
MTDAWQSVPFVLAALACFVTPALDQVSTRAAIRAGRVEGTALHDWGGTVKGYLLQAGVNAFLVWALSFTWTVHPVLAIALLVLLAGAYGVAAIVNWRHARG